MQLLWLLPSLGFGLFLGVASGQWLMAAFACFTFVLLAIGLLVRQNRQPIRDTDALVFNNGKVQIGFRKLPRFTWLWSVEIRNRVVEAVLTENCMRVAQLKTRSRTLGNLAVVAGRYDLKFLAGFRGSEEIILDLCGQGPHAFICGPTGSGKSQFLRLALQSMLESYSPESLQLITLDFKGGSTLSEFQARTLATTTDLDSNHESVFELIHSELRARELLLRDQGASRIEASALKLRLVVAVDELAPLLQIRGAQEALEAIASRGRSLGVHLIATAQSTAGISRSLLVNLGMRVATGSLDQLESAQLGFRANPSNNFVPEGLLRGQVLAGQYIAHFGFPILQISNPQNQIHLVHGKTQTNPRILS